MYNRAMTPCHKQQIHGMGLGNMIDLAPPQPERIRYERDTILPWEDDGGPVFGIQNPPHQPPVEQSRKDRRAGVKIIEINHSVPDQI